MKNAIKYYYNINTEDIHQYNQKYKFISANREFILCPYDKSINELEEKYNLQLYINSIGIKCHKIIKNKFNELITLINKTGYVLIEVELEARIINIKDITLFSKIYINQEQFRRINRTDWIKLWSNKIDYIEYQINQFRKKYPIIRESSDYYIGITENCISLLSNNKQPISINSCMHNRINQKTDTIEFYNPMNFIVDKRVRDISEYLTERIYDEDVVYIINAYLNYNKLSRNELLILFIRLMYPSNYFDICEQIIENREKENKLIRLINKTKVFEQNIKKTYLFIKKMTPIPEIEWISKISLD